MMSWCLVKETREVYSIPLNSIRNPELIKEEADLLPEDWLSPRFILYRKSMALVLKCHGDDMFSGDRQILEKAADSTAEWFIFD